MFKGITMKHFLCAFLIVAAVSMGSFARADHLNFKGMALGNNVEQVKVHLGYHDLGYTSVGLLKFHDSSTSTDYTTICADLTAGLDGQTHTYSTSTTNPLGSSAVDAAGRIIGTWMTSAVTADQQAGLQLAVWDALYNGGSALNLDGDLRITHASSGAVYWAGQYYAAVNGTTGSALYFHTSAHGGQSQLTAQAVPEPSSLLGLGLLALGFVRRKKSA